MHKDTLDIIQDPVARQRRLVELNVEEQCINVFKTAVVQKRRVETHLQAKAGEDPHDILEPQVHAMVYEPTTGEAKILDVNFRKYIEDLHDVYDLYTVPQIEMPAWKRKVSGKVSVKTSAGTKVDVQSVIGESLE